MSEPNGNKATCIYIPWDRASKGYTSIYLFPVTTGNWWKSRSPPSHIHELLCLVATSKHRRKPFPIKPAIQIRGRLWYCCSVSWLSCHHQDNPSFPKAIENPTAVRHGVSFISHESYVSTARPQTRNFFHLCSCSHPHPRHCQTLNFRHSSIIIVYWRNSLRYSRFQCQGIQLGVCKGKECS